MRSRAAKFGRYTRIGAVRLVDGAYYLFCIEQPSQRRSLTRQEASAPCARLTLPIEFGERRLGMALRHGVKHRSVITKHEAEFSLANPSSIFQHGLENRLKLTRRRTDDAQHLGRRRLLLKRLPQLIKQPRVLDGDDSLGGEVLDQCNLLIGEWANDVAIDHDNANRFLVRDHRNVQDGTQPAKLDCSDRR